MDVSRVIDAASTKLIKFWNLTNISVLAVCSFLLVSFITLISLFIINRLGRFAGFLLNRRHKDDLDRLFKQYTQVINDPNYYEGYAINKRHRQRDSHFDESEEVSNLIIGKWVNSFISLSESKMEMTKNIKATLRLFIIVIYIGMLPILVKIHLSNKIEMAVKFIIVAGLALLLRLLMTGINNFQISEFRLNHMSYKNMIDRSEYKGRFDRKIRRVLEADKQ